MEGTPLETFLDAHAVAWQLIAKKEHFALEQRFTNKDDGWGGPFFVRREWLVVGRGRQRPRRY